MEAGGGQVSGKAGQVRGGVRDASRQARFTVVPDGKVVGSHEHEHQLIQLPIPGLRLYWVPETRH